MSNDTHDGYMYDRGVETMSRDQLSQVQLEKLKANVAHASANVSYYQKSFAAAGVTPTILAGSRSSGVTRGAWGVPLAIAIAWPNSVAVCRS